MGSLMAGWSSPVLAGDKNKVRLMRNRSLTNEEIEAFWRQHGRPAAGDSPLSSPTLSSRRRPEETPFAGGRLKGIRSRPPPPLARGARTTTGVQWPSPSHGHHVSARSEPSSPATRVTTGFFPEEDAVADSPSTSRDWWTRSSWAFLNEPRAPQAEEEASSFGGRAQQRRYTCDQLRAARIVTGNA